MFQDEDSFNAAGLDLVNDLHGGERRLSPGQGDAGDQGDEGDGEQRPGESHHLCVSYSRYSLRMVGLHSGETFNSRLSQYKVKIQSLQQFLILL